MAGPVGLAFTVALLQDFSLDPDIHRMHMAAQHMVRNLTAGMALITCREPLLLSISNNLKTAFATSLRVRSLGLRGAVFTYACGVDSRIQERT